MIKIKNNLKLLGTFLGGVVGLPYVGKILEYKEELAAAKEAEIKAVLDKENITFVQNHFNKLIERTENLGEKVDKLVEIHLPESQLLAINEKLNYGINQCIRCPEKLLQNY